MHCHPKPRPGSANKRKLDAPGNELDDRDKEHCGWSHILVPGELKSNPREDNHSPHGPPVLMDSQSSWLLSP
jgi:hypothetical protein